MSWPQYIVVGWLLFTTLAGFHAEVANREQTSGRATLGVFMRLAITASTIFVLHSGGFW